MSWQRSRTEAVGWERYRTWHYAHRELGLSIDVSRVRFADDLIDTMSAPLGEAFAAMEALEAGERANRSELRQVGHYWLRDTARAPTAAIASEVEATIAAVREFAAAVHEGSVAAPAGRFEHLVHVGIGGSALGPQLLCGACAPTQPPVRVHFLDNADPDSIDALLDQLGAGAARTLVSVVSKSGITPTPWHVMLELEAAFSSRGLDFARHAVATTLVGTPLDRRASEAGWLARFPLWEWVGGRTSVTSAVGLLPAALQGIDVEELLHGAAAMDRATRHPDARGNPAALLALAWHWLGEGRGSKRMVVLPYRDRLALLPRYVQQLVMESIGKRHDRHGNVVMQGLTVYGNKGSTDQHAYLQQLREGTPDFFVTFVGVEAERDGPSPEVEEGLTLGDHLFGYLEGTRDALYERGRASITIMLPDVSPRSLGALIALYERAVGLYAELIDVNAYDQPGVDKHAAARVVALQRRVTEQLSGLPGPATAEEIADALGEPDAVETIYKLLKRLARRSDRGVVEQPADVSFEERFHARESAR